VRAGADLGPQAGGAVALGTDDRLVGATNGIGYRFQLAGQSFDLPAVWAWIALVGIPGNALNWLFVLVEHRVLSWHQHTS
jgi:ABC-type nitrate/sulfonate/bicarbonate transport system permease component